MPDRELDTIEQPEVNLPEPSGTTLDREELINQTFEEGTEDAIIEDLGSKEGDLTVEDLRQIPGSEAYTDEELIAEWKKIEAAERGGTESATDAEPYKLPFPIYDAKGNKVESLEGLSIRDLLDGKVKLGYNALGKEQQRTLAEALRNASQGHWNESKYNTTVEERNRLFQKVSELETQVKQAAQDRQIWDAAISALAMGNKGPMEQLIKAYSAEIQKMPNAAPGMISVEQAKADQEAQTRGLQYIQSVIMPKGYELAQKYGANPQEVLGAIQWYIERDLNFLTPEKINQILEYEVPALLEQNGYSPSGTSTNNNPVQQVDEVSELRNQVRALQESIAKVNNQEVSESRLKQKRIPPAGGGATPSAGDNQPNFKSRAQFKAWAAGDPDWAKA